ncbi:MAG: 4-hydroxy-tetrahydrodipicolinate synthase [Lysobacterales bacterium]|jgi:4-hydroxy-tetrahydrodipicolinate synthase|nr:MAG: 4-hydroxy-tetrahydrodipicolinate synthase [Xanthomonadales bacterium]
MRVHGCICALATPLGPDGALDLEGFRALLSLQRAAGVQGVVVAGSTGQGALLSEEEIDRLIGEVLDLSAPRPLLLVGTGAASTAQAIVRTRRAAAAGAEMALVSTPYYVRPTQEGLYRHFMAVADRGGLPIVLYNVPSRTACDLHPETVERLREHPQILGIKESRAEPERWKALLPLRKADFAVLSGDDPSMAECLVSGADGVISVAANVAPRAIVSLCAAAARGELEAVRALDASLRPLYGFLAVEPNPIPVQWLLAQRLGWASAVPRLPLTELDSAHRALGREMLALLEAFEPAHPPSSVLTPR